MKLDVLFVSLHFHGLLFLAYLLLVAIHRRCGFEHIEYLQFLACLAKN